MRKVLRSVVGGLFAVMALVACASSSPPRPMETIEDTVEASATVESVDVLNRLMTIKTEAGDLVTLEVGPEVQNLVQVRQGDRVVVRYREAIGARISNDAAGQPVSIDVDTDRARLGQRPSARASATTNVPVTINSVDTRSNLVTFSGPDGLVCAISEIEPG
jgi:translation initiation factor IF-1